MRELSALLLVQRDRVNDRHPVQLLHLGGRGGAYADGSLAFRRRMEAMLKAPGSPGDWVGHLLSSYRSFTQAETTT